MNRPRLIRWLRITASTVCLVVCGLLMALWVRSYRWWYDYVVLFPSNTSCLLVSSPNFPSTSCLRVSSSNGSMSLQTVPWWNTSEPLWKLNSIPINHMPSKGLEVRTNGYAYAGPSGQSFAWFRSIGYQGVLGFGVFTYSLFPPMYCIPHWFLVLLSATLAIVPWLPWWSIRFSIRTMLIVTAVVAMGLGIFVWLTR